MSAADSSIQNPLSGGVNGRVKPLSGNGIRLSD